MASISGPDRWAARDRFLKVAFVVYALVGFAHNYARTSPGVAEGARVALVIPGMVLMVLTLPFLAWELVRGRRSVETLGFKIATWRSSAVTVVVGAYLAASVMRVPLTGAAAAGIAVPLLGVLFEEVMFRPLLIRWLHDRFARTKRSWSLAVVLSAAIWTLIHVPSKSPSLLVGLFIAAVAVGGLYAWSGTNVAAYVPHALANSGSGGAVIMFVLCVVLGAAAAWSSRSVRAPAPAT